MERAVLREDPVAERLMPDAHLTRQPLKEVVSDPRHGVLAARVILQVVIAVHVDGRAHVDGVVAGVLRRAHRIFHVTVYVTCDLARVRAQLLEQLVCLHKVDERLEALALLVDFLVLASLQQLFLDFVQ